MIPVDQDRLYDPTLPPDQQRGNCLQAVVASLLKLPLDAVPHFVQDHMDSGGERHWWDAMVAFVGTHGWGVHATLPISDYPDEHLMVTGPSPRGEGVHHVVIYKGGELVHDPHPDRTGLRDGLLGAGSAHGLHRLDDREVRA